MYHFDGSWIPDFQFKNTDWFAGSWIAGSKYKNIDRFGGLWIPDSQLQNTGRFGGSWIPDSQFKNTDRFGGPWIPHPFLEIRTKSAVRGSLYPISKFSNSFLTFCTSPEKNFSDILTHF